MLPGWRSGHLLTIRHHSSSVHSQIDYHSMSGDPRYMHAHNDLDYRCPFRHYLMFSRYM